MLFDLRDVREVITFLEHLCFIKYLLHRAIQQEKEKKKVYNRNLKIPMIISQTCLQTIFTQKKAA